MFCLNNILWNLSVNSVQNSSKLYFSEKKKEFANSIDPDETADYELPHFAHVNIVVCFFGALTLKAPNKSCSRRHFNFLLLSFEENKA